MVEFMKNEDKLLSFYGKNKNAFTIFFTLHFSRGIGPLKSLFNL